MLSEFGAHRQTASEGHITISSSTSGKRSSFHRRARSLFSLHWDETISSLTDLRKGHRHTISSSSSSYGPIVLQEKTISISSSLDDAPQMKKISHRRLRYTVEDNWRPYEDDIMEKHGLELDAFTGIALTTPESVAGCKEVSSRCTSRRPTERGLRQYHRPTQINVELMTTKQESAATISSAPKKPSMPAAYHPACPSPFQVSHADWSPALLSSVISLHSFNSSSSLSDDDSSCFDLSNEMRPKIWRISTTDDEEASPMLPPFRWD